MTTETKQKPAPDETGDLGNVLKKVVNLLEPLGKEGALRVLAAVAVLNKDYLTACRCIDTLERLWP